MFIFLVFNDFSLRLQSVTKAKQHFEHLPVR